MLNEDVAENSSRQTCGYVSYSQHKHEVKTNEHSLGHGAVDHLNDNRAYQTCFEHHFTKHHPHWSHQESLSDTEASKHEHEEDHENSSNVCCSLETKVE